MTVYQIVAEQTWLAQSMVNVYHYQAADVLSAAQLLEVADHFRAGYVTLDTAFNLDNAWVFEGITARRVDLPDLPGQGIAPTLGSFVGTNASLTPQVSQAAVLVSLQAPTTKPRRARSYLPGFVSGALGQDGRWVTSARDAVGDFVEWVDSITVTGDTLLRVAVEYTLSPPRVVLFNRLQTYIVRTAPGIQRRRRLGQGA